MLKLSVLHWICVPSTNGIRVNAHARVSWSVNPKERNHLGDLGVDSRIILKQILKEYETKVWATFIWFRDQQWALMNTAMNLFIF
jgi:hypothetical protein